MKPSLRSLRHRKPSSRRAVEASFLFLITSIKRHMTTFSNLLSSILFSVHSWKKFVDRFKNPFWESSFNVTLFKRPTYPPRAPELSTRHGVDTRTVAASMYVPIYYKWCTTRDRGIGSDRYPCHWFIALPVNSLPPIVVRLITRE